MPSKPDASVRQSIRENYDFEVKEKQDLDQDEDQDVPKDTIAVVSRVSRQSKREPIYQSPFNNGRPSTRATIA
jgi:hypothetical protein